MLLQRLIEEKNNLEEFINKAMDSIKGCSKGMLRISTYKGVYVKYYKVVDGKNYYIQKKDKELIRQLAQKAYAKKVLSIASKNLEEIEIFCKKYDFEAITNIYEKLTPERKELIEPYVLPDSDYATVWKSVKYQGNPIPFGGTEFFTENGERVRSKSEVIIANTLKHYGLPYRYEYPWKVKNSVTVYPDFTIIDIKSRREFILEHFGMMDNEDYREGAFKKIYFYASHGMFIGKNLLVTFEDSKNPLNTFYLNWILDEFFKKN